MGNNSLSDIFKLLWPDYSALWRGDLNGINALIVSIIIIIFAAQVIYVIAKCSKTVQRVDAVYRIIHDVDSGSLLDKRSTMKRRATEGTEVSVGNKTAFHLWQEFDETLVETGDRSALRNTVDADYFFNSESLAGEVMHNRVLAVVPSVLTAIGVLGTFIGLTTGLNGLNLNADNGVDELRDGIDTLIGGAAIAFMTSVWGVFTSLLSNIIDKQAERWLSARIRTLQSEIDGLFQRQTPEHSLINIMDNTYEARESLAELHERIGNRLQEAVGAMSGQMQSAIESSMAPALTALANSTSRQNEEALASLVEKFSENIYAEGEKQADQMRLASSGINEALNAMSTNMATIMDRIQNESSNQQTASAKASEEFREHLRSLHNLSTQQHQQTEKSMAELLGAVESISTALTTSSTHLVDVSSQFEGSSRQFATATTTLGTQLTTSAQSIEASSKNHQSAAEAVAKHATEFDRLRQLTTEAAERLAAASAESSIGFDALRKHQSSFLAELEQKYDAMSLAAKDWIDTYSEVVIAQTDNRLEAWNTQTTSFASHMLQIAQNLSNVIDEFEVKRAAVLAQAEES
ncbi:hypothetical protein DQ353_14260 [Arthrobacter sp. AQ5-05]|uniref:anti-phage ZorAB system protein ZorA n=1 Tax=Arthrobacter sp. AQ5-05 TaxID=2184581 RepID=UPI000DCD3278|nr:anti-phage ZorAB system protein ZorA [Arthrobacter sp. AQ5-05]RAX48536.1 hypothetical protein DQ353_14260 [Arthrobacter sp. AQ5-05]